MLLLVLRTPICSCDSFKTANKWSAAPPLTTTLVTMLYSPPQQWWTRFETFSLYDQLAAVPVNGCIATDFIKYLIQVISYDACASKRNTQTTYRVVNRVCQIYKEINDLIRQVDTEKGDTWANYDKYTGAIDPLEDFLFRISDLIDKDSCLWLASYDSIEDCLQSTTEWADNRTRLRDLTTDLQTKIPNFPLPFNDGIILAQKHDDSNLLSDLCSSIKAHPLEDVDTTKYSSYKMGRGWILDTKIEADKILSRISNTITDRSMELGIKCTMLVYGVMQVSSNKLNEADKLMSKTTWTRAVRLLTCLSAHLRDRSLVSFEQLEADLDVFVEYLQTITSWEPPREFLELKKKAKDVGRLYHSQTLQLVNQCRTLAMYFKVHKTATNHDLLDETIAVAAAALEAAAAATTEFKMFADSVKNEDAAAAFSAAEATLKKCFMECHMEDKWSAHEKEMESARNADRARVHQFIDRVAARKDKAYQIPNPQPISFNLRRVNISNRTFTEHRYTAGASTKLSGILWKESLEDQTVLSDWHFEQINGNAREVIRFDAEVKDIQVEGRRRTLYLVPN